MIRGVLLVWLACLPRFHVNVEVGIALRLEDVIQSGSLRDAPPTTDLTPATLGWSPQTSEVAMFVLGGVVYWLQAVPLVYAEITRCRRIGVGAMIGKARSGGNVGRKSGHSAGKR